MVYSKRWYLVHLLGGGCTNCGNQNFYDLEIDHINNDGDGERKYHTYLDKQYLQNPTKAKQRLQVLCKSCHEEKHHIPEILLGELQITNSITPDGFFKLVENPILLGEFYRIMNKDDYKKMGKFLGYLKQILKSDPFYGKKSLPRLEPSKIQLFMDELKILEGDSKEPVEENLFIDQLEKTNIFSNHDEIRNYIRKMLREASIYESKQGCYNLV